MTMCQPYLGIITLTLLITTIRIICQYIWERELLENHGFDS